MEPLPKSAFKNAHRAGSLVASHVAVIVFMNSTLTSLNGSGRMILETKASVNVTLGSRDSP